MPLAPGELCSPFPPLLALFRQQRGEDKQNIKFVPPGNVSADAHASDLDFFKFLAFFRHVLVVSYLQIQQTEIFELYKF